MAKRAVRRQARKVLGEDPVALVWCEIRKPIPTPPKDVHRAAGKGRLKPRHHWLMYVFGAVFFFVFVPAILVDMLLDRLSTRPKWKQNRKQQGEATPSDARGSGSGQAAAAPNGRSGSGKAAKAPRNPTNGIFDGDWDLTAGQLLLRWYGNSPNPKRLVMLAPDRVCVAASPRRRLSATRATDFRSVAELPLDQVRVEGAADQPRGYATFRLRFTDGSWLEVGDLAEPEDADHFLRTING
ncbi:hypothetical protein [Streptomyces sp. NPDC059134]|uniref:hypothetical protein n=1 Tax=Streptomyces sp. NPDC059134 TaxID=3346738 RepID=UPI0036A93861